MALKKLKDKVGAQITQKRTGTAGTSFRTHARINSVQLEPLRHSVHGS